MANIVPADALIVHIQELVIKVKMNKTNYAKTKIACYVGYFVQAITINLPPILFVIFQDEFNISYSQISWMVFISFGTQFVTDALSMRYVDKIGYRKSLLVAHLLASLGLVCLGFLPKILPNAFLGLIISTIIYALGSGLIEVLVSPVVENLPTEQKAAEMSLLHSFYCWGQVSVVLVSTLLIKFFGSQYWSLIAVMWALIPFANFFNFMSVPIVEPKSENKIGEIKALLKSRNFIIGLILMLCAGASELAMSQWSSLFAERSLGVSKVYGDLLGPCMFGVFMGIGRTIYGLFGAKIRIKSALLCCSAFCTLSYLITVLGNIPIMSLIGCALCGMAVSLMWPGVFSLSAKNQTNVSTAMFALLAVFGDIGCTVGPWLTGQVVTLSNKIPQLHNILGDSLKLGLLAGTIFPIIMFISILFFKDSEKDRA